jgi:8-oxo-dGTP pyrophosphatase MutT (NUDIX family)
MQTNFQPPATASIPLQAGALHEKPFKTVPSVYLVLVDGTSVLLSLRANTGYEDGMYGLVAGHVEERETVREAACREACEEAGLHLSVDQIGLTLIMHRFCDTSHPPERLDFFVLVQNCTGDAVNMEPNKCSELRWFDLNDLPVNTIPYIKHALKQIIAGNNYCEYGWSDR